MSRTVDLELIDEVLELPAPWALHHGGHLPGACIALRIEGPAGAPVVAALGGISAHRVVAGGQGWWSAIAGPGKGIDTDRFRVLGIDYIGGSGGSSTPDGRTAFPSVSTHDQAAALAAILRRRATRLHAIVGASYGGMVALSFALRYPELVDRIVVVGAADRSRPLATAWRCVQRQIVREAIERGEGAAGLRLARGLAMTTYRTAEEFSERFRGPPVRIDGRFHFPIERYLFARGEDYVRKYRPESFVTLSESIDLHDIDAALVRTPTTLIGICEDQLVPIADVRALAARLGGPCRLVQLSSLYGHDAFLKEGVALKPIIEQALEETTK